MINFNKEELLKLAKLSALKLNDQEANVLVEQIKVLLDYTKEFRMKLDSHFHQFSDSQYIL